MAGGEVVQQLLDIWAGVHEDRQCGRVLAGGGRAPGSGAGIGGREGQAESLGQAQLAPGAVALEEAQGPLHFAHIEEYPLPPHPHQGLLQRRQGGELLPAQLRARASGGAFLPPEGDAPVEADDRLRAQDAPGAARRRRVLLGAETGAEGHAAGEVGHQDRETEGLQGGAGVAQESVGLLRGERAGLRAGPAQAPRQGREEAPGAPQRAEEVALGVGQGAVELPEGRAPLLPHLPRRDEEAGVVRGLQQEAQRPRRAVRRVLRHTAGSSGGRGPRGLEAEAEAERGAGSRRRGGGRGARLRFLRRGRSRGQRPLGEGPGECLQVIQQVGRGERAGQGGEAQAIRVGVQEEAPARPAGPGAGLRPQATALQEVEAEAGGLDPGPQVVAQRDAPASGPINRAAPPSPSRERRIPAARVTSGQREGGSSPDQRSNPGPGPSPGACCGAQRPCRTSIAGVYRTPRTPTPFPDGCPSTAPLAWRIMGPAWGAPAPVAGR